MNKRVCSLFSGIIAVALTAVTIASCGGKMPDDTWQASKNINWDVDLTKPITINGMFPETGISGFGNDDSSKIIEEKTGYKTVYKELSASNADNDVANIFLNQDKYQFLKLTEAQYHPNVRDGLLLDLTELLQKSESGRILYALIDLMPYGWDAVTYQKPDGTDGIFAIPDFGYCMMEDTAFVWNKDHLQQVGITKIPETMTEFDVALHKLQDKFGSNTEYHALGIGGNNNSNISAIMSAFNCPLEYYVDEDGKIQKDIFSETIDNYVEYMHSLRDDGILATTWQNSSADAICLNFAQETHSVVSLSYWWVESLVKTIVASNKIAASMNVSNDYQTVHDECIGWNTRLRMDEEMAAALNAKDNFKNVEAQDKARLHGGDDGISYYTAIPYYMAGDALYTIDYLSKKMQHFADFYGGEEGKHWNLTETPEGAKDYYGVDENGNQDYGYQEFEDYSKKIIYLRPYEYTYSYEIDPTLEQPSGTTTVNAVTKTYTLEGTKMTVNVKGGGIWVQLTDRYMEQIVDNSQYCNGTNPIEADVLFHLRETGFDAWQVTVPLDDTVITNPMTMSPPFSSWAPVSILSRTVAKRGIATAIDSKTPTASLELTRESLKTLNIKGQDGKKYYYWSDDIVNEMTKWYTEVKLNRD